MADLVLRTCVKGMAYYGGFSTSDLTVSKNWVNSAGTRLDNPYLHLALFLKIHTTGKRKQNLRLVRSP